MDREKRVPFVCRQAAWGILVGLATMLFNGCGSETVKNGTRAEDTSTAIGPDEEDAKNANGTTPVKPVDITDINGRDRLPNYTGKYVVCEGTAFQSKANTAVRTGWGGIGIVSDEGYEWPTEVVGEFVVVYGTIAYYDLTKEREAFQKAQAKGEPIQGRVIPSEIKGEYVIEGDFWVLGDDGSRTKRLFETEPLSEEEVIRLWGP